MAKQAAPALETSLDNLESLVERMESGDLTLEESLKAFEEGVRLSRECQQPVRKLIAPQSPRMPPGPWYRFITRPRERLALRRQTSDRRTR